MTSCNTSRWQLYSHHFPLDRFFIFFIPFADGIKRRIWNWKLLSRFHKISRAGKVRRFAHSPAGPRGQPGILHLPGVRWGHLVSAVYFLSLCFSCEQGFVWFCWPCRPSLLSHTSALCIDSMMARSSVMSDDVGVCTSVHNAGMTRPRCTFSYF